VDTTQQQQQLLRRVSLQLSAGMVDCRDDVANMSTSRLRGLTNAPAADADEQARVARRGNGESDDYVLRRRWEVQFSLMQCCYVK